MVGEPSENPKSNYDSENREGQNNIAAVRLHNLGEERYSLGDLEGAEAAFLEAIEIYLGQSPDNPDAVSTYLELAETQQELDKPEEAGSTLRRALTIIENTAGAENPAFAEILSRLAENYMSRGVFQAAEPLLNQAVEIYEATVGEDHPAVAQLLFTLGTLHFELERYDKANTALRRAARLAAKEFGREDKRLAIVYNALSIVNAQLGNEADARAYATRFEKIMNG